MREGWSRLRHLMWKDWRSVRRWAVLCWLAGAAAWLLLLLPDPQELGQVQAGLTLFLPAIVVAHLFRGDSPLDADAFWRTRPIPALPQLVSKLAVGGLAIVLPWALLMAGPLAFRGLQVTPSQMAVTLATLAVLAGTSGASMALGALMTRHLVTGAVVAVAVYSALVTALTLIYRLADPNLPPAGIELRLSGLWFCMLLVVPLALYLLYRTRRARPAGAVLAIGLGLGLLLNQAWGAAVGEARMPATPIPQSSWPGISVTLEPGSGEIHDLGDGKTAAYAKVAVKGLPPAYSLVQEEYEATARTSTGEQHQRHSLYPVDRGGLRTNTLGWVRYPSQVALGCKLWGTGDTGRVQVFNLPRSASLEAVSGTLRFLIVRPYVAARHPMVSGGRVQGPGYRLELYPGSGSQPPRVRYEAVQAPFLIEANPLRNAWFHDPASGTCLSAESRTILAMGPPPLRVEDVTTSREWANAVGLTDYSWARELVLLSGEVVGSLTVPFDVRWGQP